MNKNVLYLFIQNKSNTSCVCVCIHANKSIYVYANKSDTSYIYIERTINKITNKKIISFLLKLLFFIIHIYNRSCFIAAHDWMKTKIFGRFYTWNNSSHKNHRGDGASRVFIKNTDQDMQKRRCLYTILSPVLQTCLLW